MAATDPATCTPEIEAGEGAGAGACSSAAYRCRRPSTALRVQFPGTTRRQLGRHVDSPELGYLFVNTNEWVSFEWPDSAGARGRDRASRRQGPGQIASTRRPYEGFPGGRPFQHPHRTDPQQLPCQQPPWGQLTAIDMKTGKFAWRSTLGVTDSLPPALQKTGRPGNGGTIVTRGGLVFVAATDDGRFRAFDGKTGQEVWTVTLPAAAQATPMTYRAKDGRQYVVITSTGGGFFGNPVTDDSVIAYALPAR